METAIKMASPTDIENVIREVYGRHPQLEELYLKEKNGIETDLEKLDSFPAGTLGKVYARHMIENNLDPHFYGENKFYNTRLHDQRWDYFRVHTIQTHDVWHVLSGFKTDYLGEIGVFSFLFGQVSIPVYLIIVASISLHPVLGGKRKDSIRVFQNISTGFRMGQDAKSMIGVNWDDYWTRDIQEVRRMFNISLSSNLKSSPAT